MRVAIARQAWESGAFHVWKKVASRSRERGHLAFPRCRQGCPRPRRRNSMNAVIALALILTTSAIGVAQVNAGSPLAPPVTSQAKQFRLADLKITGYRHTKLFVILRMIPISPGDIFNRSLWDFGIEQLNRSGLFEPIEPNDVVIIPDDTTGTVDVELHLKERDRQRFDLSGGGGTTGGASIALDYSNINLTGRGGRLMTMARIGTREQTGGATLSRLAYGGIP